MTDGRRVDHFPSDYRSPGAPDVPTVYAVHATPVPEVAEPLTSDPAVEQALEPFAAGAPVEPTPPRGFNRNLGKSVVTMADLTRGSTKYGQPGPTKVSFVPPLEPKTTVIVKESFL